MSDVAAPAPVNLRVDARDQSSVDRSVPLARSAHPRLSWTTPLARDGQAATAYRVRLQGAGGSATDIDSGHVASADPWWLPERPLPGDSLWTWSVSVLDENGRWSPPSASAPLETGPASLDDWEAHWVSVPTGQMVRRRFGVGKTVSRARLHLTAQGLVRAAVDAEPVNPGALDPSRTDGSRALYRTYDITDLCSVGDHALDLVPGLGQWVRTGADPRMLATVVLHYEDGSVERFGTGEGMLVSPSPVIADEPFYLERHDARVQQSWSAPPASIVITAASDPMIPLPAVSPDPGPPLRTVASIPLTVIATHTGGGIVADAGKNIAGRVRVSLTDAVPPETVLRLVHGEHLDAGSHVDTTNLRMPHDAERERQVAEFVASGAPGETFSTWFSFAGFRYVELTGLPEGAAVDLAAEIVHSDLAPTGEVRCSDALIERLVAAGRRTLLNNLHAIPEDCPTREQAGWTGDTASVADFEFAAFDMEAFHAKWLDDLVASQDDDGAVPAVVPHLVPPAPLPDPVWGSALPRVLESHWLHYGDRRVLDDALPGLRAWCRYLIGLVGASGVVDGAPISYGHDWLGLQQTPPELLHTAAAIAALETLGRLERDRGAADDAAVSLADAARLRAAARERFVDPETGDVANGSQGAVAVALESGIVPERFVPDARRRLTASIRERGNRISSGFASTRAVVAELARGRDDQVLRDVLSQPDEPGVGAMLDHGPGTFWECWWIDPENTGTGSLDHVGLGGPFAGWVWWGLAGLRPVAPGYARFRVEPRPVDGIDYVAVGTDTVRGRIDVGWARGGDALDLDITVPVGAEAVVPVAGVEKLLGSGRHSLRVPWPVAEPAPAPTAGTPFPQRRAPRPADVDRDADLLARTVAGATSTAALEVLPDGIDCMPVPHEREPGPVLRLVAAPGARDAVSRIPTDLDLSGARFVAVRLDLDLPVTSRPLQPVLVLHGADGTTVTGSGVLWPAGWSRVSADVSSWPGRERVVRIDVGVRAETGAAADEEHGPAVHIAALGWSSRRRLW